MQDDIKRFFYPARRFLARGVHAELSVGWNTNYIRVDWASLPGLTYVVETSSNLVSWFSGGASNYLGDGFYQTYQVVLSTQPAKFFRLKSEYVPTGGGEGRFFFLNNTNGPIFTVTCIGLVSGACQTSILGPGSFTYSERSPSQASLAINLSSGEQVSLNLAGSNTNSGSFQGVYVHGSKTNLLGGGYETLRTP